MVYTLILSNKNKDVTISIIFCKIISYTDVFFKENAEKLSKNKKGDYVIELNKQDFSFGFLYNLSNLKLKILWKYLDNALIKRWIRHFISSVKTSVLFILKRDGSFYLYVDYWVLNKITIKNHHTLLFINKTLNWLIKIKWFIKFDLKNVYY